ncbi:Biotin carboxyl carrier protein of acetyl-CoA [Musa troglodytarum]|uniref:Biotin carboxyl carrier protein of acetyl-CoA n=1 Tax=Musa troglodytarum TaxID=320322 RepID=A0A9E7FJ41_9LILI|nr:Biotin carboxyl carrier protein of acetyl-CoA [Musa troglodytarum]
MEHLRILSTVGSLLTTICDTTSIAEFKMDTSTANQIPESNGSVAITSVAVSKTKTSNSSIQRIVDTASDEGLMILQSLKKQEVKEGQPLCYIEQLGGEIPIEVIL